MAGIGSLRRTADGCEFVCPGLALIARGARSEWVLEAGAETVTATKSLAVVRRLTEFSAAAKRLESASTAFRCVAPIQDRQFHWTSAPKRGGATGRPAAPQ